MVSHSLRAQIPPVVQLPGYRGPEALRPVRRRLLRDLRSGGTPLRRFVLRCEIPCFVPPTEGQPYLFAATQGRVLTIKHFALLSRSRAGACVYAQRCLPRGARILSVIEQNIDTHRAHSARLVPDTPAVEELPLP